MEKAIEFPCPICNSLCQTTEQMRGKEMQCLMCTATIRVPTVQPDISEGLDIEYFLQAGVVTRRMRGPSGQEPTDEPVPSSPPPGAGPDPDRKTPLPGSVPTLEAAAQEATPKPPPPEPVAPAPPAEPERLLFRESVKLDGQNLALAVSNLKFQPKGMEPIAVDRIRGLRLVVTPNRDLVTGEILYHGPQEQEQKMAVEISRFLASKVAQVAGAFVRAMRQVMPENATVELLDQKDDPQDRFWQKVSAEPEKESS